MGARKRLKAEEIKAAKRQKAFAILRDVPTSPRKMRLVVDMVRGKEVKTSGYTKVLFEGSIRQS